MEGRGELLALADRVVASGQGCRIVGERLETIEERGEPSVERLAGEPHGRFHFPQPVGQSRAELKSLLFVPQPCEDELVAQGLNGDDFDAATRTQVVDWWYFREDERPPRIALRIDVREVLSGDFETKPRGRERPRRGRQTVEQACHDSTHRRPAICGRFDAKLDAIPTVAGLLKNAVRDADGRSAECLTSHERVPGPRHRIFECRLVFHAVHGAAAHVSQSGDSRAERFFGAQHGIGGKGDERAGELIERLFQARGRFKRGRRHGSQ